ncbi:substrate-binding domain-containing protein [Lichenifustis flavocetrariae]|uniref:Substrate-binding domain-containing protein n=1 Tax=Lichenifustis flavocetrariae TaxID=2949735 RepID=A0AA41YZX7_9HYPH|nr:substrate-binding domain-containing protein [Lichenifustis flavocetrariae]MCW6511214.1 substrate-binding domain-containing protein [Lichenifustis flavocetrariae]
MIDRRRFIASGGLLGLGLGGGLWPYRAIAAGTPIIAFSQADLINDWRVTNQQDMKEHVEGAGYKFITASSEDDPAKQLSDIQSMLAQQPSVLVVAPLESVALAPAVGLADDAGIPMIVIDRTLAAEPGTGMYKAEIVQSHYNSGKLLAEKAVELLKAKNGAPKGSVVRVQGIPGSSPVIDAGKGWDDVMKPYPEVKTVGASNAGFTKDGGIKVMQDFLQRFPKGQIDIVWSDYSDMTMGAIQAIKDAGRSEILGNIVGEGGQIAAIEAVTRGEIARETQTPPYFGEIVIQNVKKLLAGQPIEPKQNLPILVFDADKKADAQAYLDKIKGKGLKF